MRSRLQPVLLAVCVMPLVAADWPQWRGPNRDGAVPDFTAPAKWPERLQEVWRVPVGEGYASPLVVGDKVFIFTRQNDQEVARCLEADSGKEVWKAGYPAPYEVNPVAAGHGKGPKSTPAVHAGKLFTFGINGVLSCFDAATGKVKWRKDFAKEFPKTAPLYGTAMSPIVVDGMCVAHVGGHDKGALTAFDADTGDVKWAWDGDGPGYASPLLVELAGQRQIVSQSQSFFLGVAAKTGKLLWKVPFTTQYEQNCVTPVLAKELLIYSGYNRPVEALRLKKSGEALTPQRAWSNANFPMYMSTPVVKGGRLFGMSQRRSGQIFCLDAATSRTRWQNDGRMGENVALLLTGEALLLLTNKGELIVVNADAPRYEVLAKYRVADTPTWATPAVVGQRIWIKDQATLACFRLAE